MARPKKVLPVSPKAAIAELAKRAEKPAFDITQHCFKEQLALVMDPADFATACTSRRAGKTIGCAADLIDTAQKRPDTVMLYITLSRSSAKRIIWPELMKLNHEYGLGGIPNIADLSLTFPNGSVIYCSGAKNKSEIEKFRGLAIALCYIDEAQSFGSFIEELIDDVISKALYDYNGRLRVIGTPSPVPSGFFYDICEGKHADQWSHHHWDMRNNPWLYRKSGKTALQLIQRDLDRKGVTIDDPSIQREAFGLWATDLNSLVFKYDKDRNTYTELPEVKQNAWNYIIGIDLGFDDADAFAVIAYHDNLKCVYLVEEITNNKQGITELAAQADILIKKYNPHSIVMDTGGLGKKIADELNRRYSLTIKAAEKSRKHEFIELLNDSMRTGTFLVKENGKFAQDCMLVEWDKERSRGDKRVVSTKFHSDICDAVLYAFRESLHFLSVPIGPKIQMGSPEWYNKQVQEMEEAAMSMLETAKGVDQYNPGAEHISKVWKDDE